MRPQELATLLRDFTAEKVALKRRHEAGAREVGEYDFNNTYQYIIAREEAHLDWLRRALVSLGAALPDPVLDIPVPSSGKGLERQQAIFTDDHRHMTSFIERWRGRIEQVGDTRQKLMLGVILGEMLEQQRFFAQAAAGRRDLLGRRTSPSRPEGTVMADRWVE